MRAVVLVALAACGRFGFGSGAANVDSAPDADTSGLVAYWAMEDVTSDVVQDASGHGHDAVCSSIAMSCPTVVAGKVGNGLRFDGSNDHLVIGPAPELDTTVAFTVTAWLWIDTSPSSAYYCFANKPFTTGLTDSWQACVTNLGQLFFGTSPSATATGDSMYSGNGSIVTNTWIHVAIRWDGTTKTILLDGVLAATQSAATGFDGSAVWLGYDVDNATPVAPFAGILDEVRLYNRALADAEIRALAQ